MNHPLPPGSILPALRAATGEAHQRFEDAIAIERRLSDLTRYRQLLEIFLGFYRPLENRLVPTAERRKTPWLEADLRALDLTAPQIDALPDCPELPSVDTSARAMGCRYVLEGATLGGRQISAMMDRGGAVPAEARRFFGGYGEQTGERWREFIAALEQCAAGAGAAEKGEIIQGASEAFACLHRWFVRHCPTDAFCG